MDLEKRTCGVKDAIGWYLLKNEYRTYTDEITDTESGETKEVERTEILCGKGTCINEITASLLRENGITEVCVSNIPLLGSQEKYLNLWEANVKIRSKGGISKKTYYVTADSPADAEKFISEYLMLNVECSFELTKINMLEYGRVIRLYDTELDEFEKDGTKKIKWYKCQIYSIIDDDGESKNAGMKNILISAIDFSFAYKAARVVMNRDEYDNMYNTFKSLQELNVANVFIPETSVAWYSNLDLE